MDEKKPSPRSRTKSSAAASKAGSGAKPAARPAARPAAGAARPRAASRARPPRDPLALLDELAGGEFPASVYLEGPDEAVKAAFLAEFRRAWARAVPEAPQARVMRPGEQDVDAILAAYQNVSLFTPRELTIVFDIEDVGRSEKKVAALAQGLAIPAGGSCLVFVESGSETPRKTLEPLRAACHVRLDAQPPGEGALLAWGRRRIEAAGCGAEPGALEALLEACERDALVFLNEAGKLAVLGAREGRVTRAHVAALTAPRLGADLPEFLGAVAAGDAPLAAQRLERLLAAGESEGSVLWALGHLSSSALALARDPRAWARWRELSQALGHRRTPRELARALDAVYRAESAWKGGRADARTALEQATREVAAH